jgi:hypothetical protein
MTRHLDRLLGGLTRVVLDEPVRILSVATAVGALLAFLGVDSVLLGLIGAILAALLELARRVVTPVGTAADALVQAAVQAAELAVLDLDESDAGAVGEITVNGRAAVETAVADAAATVLDATGLNPKGRKVVIR